MDLFIPRNLDLHEDGSVTPHDFGKNITPKDNESLSEYSERYNKELSDLKDYERNKVIPDAQKKELWQVKIYKEPTHKTVEEDKQSFNSTLMFDKLFLEKDKATKWAENKIKQQSIGCYHSKDNPHSRQYKVTAIVVCDNEKTKIRQEALNGKIILKDTFKW